MNTAPSRHTNRVATPSPAWAAEADDIRRGMRLAAKVNKLGIDDAPRIREVFGELTGQPVDESFMLLPPSIPLAHWRPPHLGRA